MKRLFYLCVGMALVVGALPSRAEAAIGLGDKLDSFTLYDTQRRLRSWADYDEAKAVAIVFASTECPLVKLYLPTLKALATEYEGKGVQVLMVNADPGDSFNRVAGNAWEQKLPFPVLKDFEQSLAKALGATRTPEVFLLDGDRAVRYQGRIDDQYTVTHRRAAPKAHDLRNAINEVLAGKAVTVATTSATGCVIDFDANPYASEALTFEKDIAPIVSAKCLECHQKGRVGQISFATYRQVKRFSKTIREVVSEQRMPPWHADPHYGDFRNNRSLSDDERLKLLAWIDGGAVEGKKGAGALVKEVGDDEFKWVIGEPDLVISLPAEEQVPATGTVDYRYQVVDPGFTEDVWVQAAEAKPGNAEVVHHVIAYIESPNQRVFSRDGETAILVGWAPGDMPAQFDNGIARRVPAGSKIRFELHYTPNGEATTDRSSIGIVFAKSPPEREIHTNIMWQRELSIPKGAPWHAEESTYRFRKDARILSLMPHMHVRGTAARYVLRFPDGKQETLLSVPNYDFNWQSVYRFKEPIQVPKGAELTVMGVWDNSADNPANPDPNRVVPWGDQTWDEMLNGWVDFVYEEPDNPRKIAALVP